MKRKSKLILFLVLYIPIGGVASFITWLATTMVWSMMFRYGGDISRSIWLITTITSVVNGVILFLMMLCAFGILRALFTPKGIAVPWGSVAGWAGGGAAVLTLLAILLQNGVSLLFTNSDGGRLAVALVREPLMALLYLAGIGAVCWKTLFPNWSFGVFVRQVGGGKRGLAACLVVAARVLCNLLVYVGLGGRFNQSGLRQTVVWALCLAAGLTLLSYYKEEQAGPEQTIDQP